MENIPYVCVRIPTGGGKTVLASNSITVAKDFLQRDFSLVLWLVPSKTILNQTVEALKNKHHPYRESINKQFGNNVIVYNIDEYKQITKNDINNNVCIVVSTIQKLKITDKDGRKIYGDFEDYQDFFTNINNTDNLDMDPEKNRPVYSFVNICNIYRPMVIVDEAHNAIKPLSEELHRRINPSLKLEFTATPKQRNNVLISVSAQTLKDEHMIKMPIEWYEYEKNEPVTEDGRKDFWNRKLNNFIASLKERFGGSIGEKILLSDNGKDFHELNERLNSINFEYYDDVKFIFYL